jgi:hypothetical protein
MESNITPNTQYTQVTVDVPQDRVAEFHALFARFLARAGGRRPRGRHGRFGHGRHGRGCAHGRGPGQRREDTGRSEPGTEVTEA